MGSANHEKKKMITDLLNEVWPIYKYTSYSTATQASYQMMDAWVNSSDEARGTQKKREFNNAKREHIHMYLCYCDFKMIAYYCFWQHTCTLYMGIKHFCIKYTQAVTQNDKFIGNKFLNQRMVHDVLLNKT